MVRIPTLLNTAIKGANMAPHHILTLVLALADIIPSASSGLGAFDINCLCGLLYGDSKDRIAIVTAQRVQSGP